MAIDLALKADLIVAAAGLRNAKKWRDDVKITFYRKRLDQLLDDLLETSPSATLSP